jgi:putative membrane protein
MGFLISQILLSVLGLWLATIFVPRVEFTGSIQTFLTAGAILGILNFFLKPLLKKITLPLRILTLGLFGFVINMLMVWLVDIFFPELIIPGVIPLFWTTLTIWALNYIISRLFQRRERFNKTK